ncbi:MAG: helix-turn-helix transcriptional regulator [Clostridia bacterium]|nr:helix-turn-helix transcriptional regulator [Clostridia bacterium]
MSTTCIISLLKNTYAEGFETNGLKKVRTICNFSSCDFANALGVTRQMISAWENGTKSIPKQQRKHYLIGSTILFNKPTRHFWLIKSQSLLSALALIIYGLYLILRNPFKYKEF